MANSKADYPAGGQVSLIRELLATVQPGIPADREVIVQADRGIGTSSDLCRAVTELGWSYVFRVTSTTKVCTLDGDYAIASMVQPGEQWSATGLVFKTNGRLPATAHAIWDEGCETPWALVTNAPGLTGREYAMRNWQEQSFRDLKSGGWHWHDSRITHPDHMARLLVLLTLAYAWAIALGSLAVSLGRAQPLQRHADGRVTRHWSLFREGLQFFFEVVLRQDHFVALHFCPDSRFT